MQALFNVHLKHHNLSPKQFLRSAYMWKFGKDVSDLSLANDLMVYQLQGKIPNYARDYLIHCYGTQ